MNETSLRQPSYADLSAEVERLRHEVSAYREAALPAPEPMGARFLAAASHDLRQPLQALTMLVSVLADRHRDNGERPLIEKLEAAVASLGSLITGVFDFFQMDAGLVAPSPTECDLGPLLGAVAREATRQTAAKGIAIRAEPCGERVRSDRSLLARMVSCLAASVIKHTPEGGGEVVLAARRDGAEVRIEVHGSGIPPERQPEMFTALAQPEQPARGRAIGGGLGLAIVARVGRLLGHPIAMRSRAGEGATFTITVPAAGGTMPALPHEGRPARPLVLLVEDDPLVLEATAELLTLWNFEVMPAATAEAALSLLADEPRRVDAVIADYRLPSMTGLDVVEAARRRWPSMLGLIVTGDLPPERLAKATGGIRLMQKPIRPTELRHMLAGISAA